MRNDSSDAPRAGPSTLEVSFTFQPRNGQRNGREGPDKDQVVEPGNVPRVSKIMALAIRFHGLVRRGEVRDYTDLARLGYVTPARMTQIMCLLHLAPDIQEALLFLPRTLQEVIRAVRKCGAKADRNCGIHVHVDASRFDGRTLGNLAKTVYKQEPLILAALGVTENRQQTYTRPMRDNLIRDIERHRPRTTDELNRIWYGYHNRHPQHFDSTRYHGVNLHNVWHRGTVEFRWFKATLHAGKVKAYIQLVLAVATKALNGRAASSRKRRFDPRSARYDFRVFLLHLEMIGDEFKTARKHLLARLPGGSAFKRGRSAPEAPPAIEAEPIATEAGPQTRPPAFEEEITTQTEGENTA